MNCDVDEAMEGLRMSCDVGEAMESLENELCDVGKATEGLRTLLLLHLHHSSFSNSSFASPVSQDCHITWRAAYGPLLPQSWQLSNSL